MAQKKYDEAASELGDVSRSAAERLEARVAARFGSRAAWIRTTTRSRNSIARPPPGPEVLGAEASLADLFQKKRYDDAIPVLQKARLSRRRTRIFPRGSGMCIWRKEIMRTP